jgi:hypothetical protein
VKVSLYQCVTENTVGFVAGNIRNFANEWAKYTTDGWILQTVAEGYRLEFENTPFQIVHPNPIHFAEPQLSCIRNEVDTMLNKGAIAYSQHEAGQFVSNLFLVKKKNGKFRPVINLKSLNAFIEYSHFKMETLDVILGAVQRNDFFISVDLRDAYFSIPIFEGHRKFLKFQWQGQLYEFCSLPFGLSSAPRLFTKIMKPIFAHLRKMGIISFYYIDDSFIMAQLADDCHHFGQILIETLQSLGFFINFEKSTLIPTQSMVCLGFLVNSVAFTVSLTRDQANKILALCDTTLRSQTVSVRALSSLIGYFTSAARAVRLSQFNYRELEWFRNKALYDHNLDYDDLVCLPDSAKSDIHWWLENLDAMNGTPIRPSPVDRTMETDASMVGWGAKMDQCVAQGHWNRSEQYDHINVLELRAVYFGLKSLCSNLSSCHIRVQCDNTTTVAYINNIGGSKRKLFYLTKEIALWCHDRNIWLSACHIAGVCNTVPDHLSREFSDVAEWKLKENIFTRICHTYFVPDIDLFASRLNAQLDQYVSWKPDPDAFAIDAMKLLWHGFNPYIFPPFSMISAILSKIREDGVEQAIMVVPCWPTQAWFPLILQMLASSPVKLPVCKDILRQVHDGRVHPLRKTLHLTACCVSANLFRVEDYQNQSYSSVHGGSRLTNNISMLGINGLFGVVRNRSITFAPLRHRF